MAVIKKIIFSDNSNRVGIGTTTPTATLDVSGSAFVTGSISSTGDIYGNTVTAGTTYTTRISGAGAGAWIYFGVAGSNALGTIGRFGSLMQFDSDTPFSFKINGGEKVRIDTNGNVGIGTTSPSALLDVNGVANIRVSNDLNWYLTTGTNGTAVSFRAFNNAKNSLVVGEIEASTLRLNTIGGNVGIGVLSPNAKLHITGSAIIDTVGGNSSLTISNSNSSGYSVLNLKNTGGTAQSYHLSVGGSAVGGLAQSFYIYDETNNATRFYVKSDGNIGIGTTSPASKLDINGASIFRDTLNIGPGIGTISWGSSGGGTGFGIRGESGRALSLGSNGNWDYIVINTSGNVGIGTTSPSAKLHVTGAANGEWIAKFVNTGTTPYGLSVDTSNAAGEFTFAAYTNTGTGFFVRNNGNVGIGTTTPQRRIDVLGGDIMVRSTSNTGTSAVNFGSTDYYPRASIRSTGLASPVGDANLSFWTRTGGNEYERITILNDGNVGIGTTTPLTILNLSGGGGAVYQTFTDTTNAYHHGYVGKNGGGLVFGFSSQNGSFSADEKMRITTSGNVGIGATSPAYKLDVNGAINTNTGMYVQYPYGDAYPLVLTGTSFLKANANYYGMLIKTGDVNYLSGGIRIVGGANPRLEIQAYEEAVGPRNVIIPYGNFGIGTNSPTQLLHVSGSVRINGGIYDSSNSIGTNGQVLTSTGTGLSWSSAGSGTISGTGTANYVARFSTSTNITTGSLYDNGSSVGIGTTTPVARLHVASGSAGGVTYPIFVDNPGASGVPVAGIGFSNGSFIKSSIAAAVLNDDYMVFNVGNNTERMRIAASGNVGIGTTSPTSKLYVSGDITANVDNSLGVKLNRSATNVWNGIGHSTANVTKWFVGLRESGDDNLRWYNYTNSAERMVLTEAGNLGIGTTSPSQLVEASKSQDGDTAIQVTNSSTGTAATAQFFASNGTTRTQFYHTGTSYGTVGAITANQGGIYNGTSAGLAIVATNASSVIKFATGGTTEKMRLDANGNLGIGTTSPGFKLDVDRSSTGTVAAFRGSGITTGNQINVLIGKSDSTYNTSTIIWRHAGGDGSTSNYLGIGVWDNDYILNVVANGRVGIGTTTPAYKLDVSGSVRTGDTTLYSAAGTNPKMFFSSSVGSSSIRLEVVPDGGLSFIGSNGQLFGISDSLSGSLMNVSDISGLPIFEVFSDDKVVMGKYGTNALVVTGSSVGIGTSTPKSKLHITGSTAGDGGSFSGDGSIVYIRQHTGWSGNQPWALFVEGYSYLNGFRINANDGIRALYKTASGGQLGFAVAGNDPITFTQNDSSERMRIAAGGNVGIGTTSPAELLDIAASADNSATAGPKINFKKGSTNKAVIGIGGNYLGQATNTDDLIFRNDAGNILFGFSGAEKMRINSGGNVGIGTITPTAKLDVNGNAFISGSLKVSAYNNVGIGTNVVNWPLTVAAPGNTGLAIVTTDLALGSAGTIFYLGLGASTGTTYGSLEVTDALVPANRQNIIIQPTSAARVGIGKTTPNAKLDVLGDVIITGSLTVTAPITASTLTVTNLNVSTISSSVVYSSGSNVFGNTTSNKQQFTGSVQINGTLTTNDAVETTDVFGLKSFTKSLTVTTSWSDTGISGTDLATGTYIIQVLVDNYDVSGGQYTEYYSGTMSWYSGGTNSTDYDEIVLHKAGHAPNGNWINLRTLRQTGSNPLKLQIIANGNTSGADNYIFKFRRMI